MRRSGRDLLGLGMGVLLGVLPSLGAVSPALAQDGWLGIDEVRGGLYKHSFDRGPDSVQQFFTEPQLQDFNVELLFAPLDLGDFNGIAEIRPQLGATINFDGLESMAYAGIAVTTHPFDGPVFIEGALGGAIHNGALEGAVEPARNLGCRVLFHESVSVGYDFTPDASLILTVEHASNAGLCGDNRGLSNMGLRFGMKF